MKSLIRGAVLLTALGFIEVAAAQTDTPEERAKAAERYFKAWPTRELLADLLQEVSKQMPAGERAALEDTLLRQIRLEVLDAAAKQSLAKHLTVAEIDWLTDIARDPVGKSAMAKMKYYMADILPVVMQELTRVSAQSRPVVPQVQVERGMQTRPIPPSAGYTAEFEALHKRPESDDAAIVQQLKPQLDRVRYPYLYEYARRSASSDADEAVVTFWRASIRARYDALRCTDRTAGQGILMWPTIAGKAAELARSPEYKARMKEMLLRAAELEEKADTDYEPSTICFHGISATQAGIEKKPLENWHVARSEWTKIHQKVLQSARDAANRTP